MRTQDVIVRPPVDPCPALNIVTEQRRRRRRQSRGSTVYGAVDDLWPYSLIRAGVLVLNYGSQGQLSDTIDFKTPEGGRIQGRSQDLFLPRQWGSWGGGAASPSPPARGLVSAVSSPSRVRGEAPVAKRFSRVLSVQNRLSRQFSAVYCSLFHSSNFCQGKSYKKQPNRLPRLLQWTQQHWHHCLGSKRTPT